MEVLVLRMVLPVMTILLVTVMQRRFGHRLGGRVAGLPLTSCPLLVILLMTDGRTAAAQAAAGVVAGQLGVTALCLGYGRLGHRLRSPLAAVGLALGTAAAALALVSGIGSTPVAAVLVIVATAAGLLTWPPVAAQVALPNPARWETPVRVLVTVSIVVCLTGSDRLLGPHLTGLLAGTPVVMWIFTLTTHRNAGFPAAESLLRGALCSVLGTLAFALTIACSLRSWGAPASFGAAFLALIATDFVFRRLLDLGRDTLRFRRFGSGWPILGWVYASVDEVGRVEVQ